MRPIPRKESARVVVSHGPRSAEPPVRDYSADVLPSSRSCVIIHDMSVIEHDTPPTPGPSRSQDETEPRLSSETRNRILDAARELVLQQHPAALTVREIATSAGVSARTVYRYFPTKDELIQAVATRPTERIPGLTMPDRWDEVRGVLRVHWRLFGENLDMLRSERMIPGGVELRRARLRAARPQFERLLADAGLPAAVQTSPLVDILIHLTSSTTLLELIDRHGMSVDEATDAALDALERLVESIRTSPTSTGS